MNVEEIRDYAISFESVEESFPFGNETLVFKVKGKIFLLLSLESEPLSLNVKCNPDIAIELRESYDCILPGWHMNKKHWNTLIINGMLRADFIKKQIENSYNLVKRRK